MKLRSNTGPINVQLVSQENPKELTKTILDTLELSERAQQPTRQHKGIGWKTFSAHENALLSFFFKTALLLIEHLLKLSATKQVVQRHAIFFGSI